MSDKHHINIKLSDIPLSPKSIPVKIPVSWESIHMGYEKDDNIYSLSVTYDNTDSSKKLFLESMLEKGAVYDEYYKELERRK